MDMVVAQRLTRRFDGLLAVDELSLTVAEGEVLGLLGPNGAGKTTTLRMLAGLIRASSGRAKVAGVEVTDSRYAGRARALVGVLPEEVGLYGDLSVARTLDFFARLYHVPPAERSDRVEHWLTRLGLWERRDNAAATLSKGLKQRLALARALVHEPPVVLLDEPTANLDPEAATVVREVLTEMRAAGRAVVVNTHRLEEAERVCDRVAILRTRLLRVGTPQELRQESRGFHIQIEVERWSPDLQQAAAAAGATVVEVDGGSVSCGLPAGPDGVPALVAALVGAGAAIRAVVPRSESLERVYLDVIEGGTS